MKYVLKNSNLCGYRIHCFIHCISKFICSERYFRMILINSVRVFLFNGLHFSINSRTSPIDYWVYNCCTFQRWSLVALFSPLQPKQIPSINSCAAPVLSLFQLLGHFVKTTYFLPFWKGIWRWRCCRQAVPLQAGSWFYTLCTGMKKQARIILL